MTPGTHITHVFQKGETTSGEVLWIEVVRVKAISVVGFHLQGHREKYCSTHLNKFTTCRNFLVYAFVVCQKYLSSRKDSSSEAGYRMLQGFALHRNIWERCCHEWTQMLPGSEVRTYKVLKKNALCRRGNMSAVHLSMSIQIMLNWVPAVRV